MPEFNTARQRCPAELYQRAPQRGPNDYCYRRPLREIVQPIVQHESISIHDCEGLLRTDRSEVSPSEVVHTVFPIIKQTNGRVVEERDNLLIYLHIKRG